MMQKLKQLFLKYQEIILYVFFGGMTTVVDWGISFLLYYLDVNVHVSNVIAWVCAVLFAFITNRIIVFRSQKRSFGAVLGELATFSGGRVLTLIMQELIVFGLVDCLNWNKYLVKIVAAVLVTVANYFISKLLVFRKK